MQDQTVIHPSAVVEPGASIGIGARIGPFCYVGADAVVGDRVVMVSHVSVLNATRIGEGCIVYPMATLGAPPQNAKHQGGRTTLTIGANCTIREGVTMHVGTDMSRGATEVGENGNFLAYAHIAHDCVVGKNATFANGATLGGHCEVGDNVGIGGLTAVHQFVRIGDNAFLGGCSAILGDVIPFGMASGNRANLEGLNVVGLKRAGVTRSELHLLRRTYKTIFDRSHTLAEGIAQARDQFSSSPAAMKIIEFVSNRGKRNYVLPRVNARLADDDDAED